MYSKDTLPSDINKVLFDILNWNNKVQESLEYDLSKNGRKRKVKKGIEEKVELPKEEKEKKETELLDVQSYLDNIESCDSLDFITDILPSSYDNKYDAIIYAILMQIYKNIVFANSLLCEANSLSEKEYIIEDIKRNKSIIEIIKQYYKEEKEEALEERKAESIPPTFIYLTNEMGKPYIYDDIDAINENDYPFINLLFKSFSNGSKEKRFKSLEELREISAIRKRDGRIIFSRLDNNVIVVLGVIVKRFQNTTSYRDFLRRRAKVYLASKAFIKDNLDNEEFLISNRKITESLGLENKQFTLRKRPKNGTDNS